MQQKTRILLASSIAVLILTLVGVTKLAIPHLQNKARLKLQSWVKNAPVDLTFDDVKILWNGIRIVRLEVKRGKDNLLSNVNVTFGLDSTFPFVKPAFVTLDRPRIRMYRHAEPIEVSEPKHAGAVAIQPLAELLDRYFSAGISVRLRKANVQILGSSGEVLLKIPALNATLNADDRTAQIATGDFIFKTILTSD
ncbi:MAG: hypothetical protein EOP10_21390, partial [Proteobacteria bacterium]